MGEELIGMDIFDWRYAKTVFWNRKISVKNFGKKIENLGKICFWRIFDYKLIEFQQTSEC